MRHSKAALRAALQDASRGSTPLSAFVIGQDVWDQESKVASFVKQMGDQMTYRVALDDKSRGEEGFMASVWWKGGTNQHGIPMAFVINKKGRIAWMGHPMDLDEKTVADALADKPAELTRKSFARP